jgi:DNA-directed RNA polymerase specialized sigma24 family protein
MPETGLDDPVLAAYLDRRPTLVRFLAARAGSLAAAEDLAQELYQKLAARDREAVVENPNALLYRMALNLMLDRARTESRSAARDAAWRQVSRGGLRPAPAPAGGRRRSAGAADGPRLSPAQA